MSSTREADMKETSFVLSNGQSFFMSLENRLGHEHSMLRLRANGPFLSEIARDHSKTNTVLALVRKRSNGSLEFLEEYHAHMWVLRRS